MAKLTLSKIREAMNSRIAIRKNEKLSPIVQQEVDSSESTKPREEVDISSLRKVESLRDILPPSTKTNTKTSKSIISPSVSKALRLPTREEIREFVQDLETVPENYTGEREVNIEISAPSTEIVSLGRRNTEIDRNLFSDGLEDFTRKNKIGSNEQFIRDAVRGVSARYWTLDEENKGFQFLYDNRELDDRKLPFRFIYRGSVANDKQPSDFGRTEQWIILQANDKMFQTARKRYSKQLWSTYIKGGPYRGSSTRKDDIESMEPTVRENNFYFDHSYTIDLPFEKKELERMSPIHGALHHDVQLEYNFYIKDYEDEISSNPNVLDNTLPNMYVFMSELSIENPNPEFQNFITLDDKLTTDEQLLVNQQKEFDIKTHPIGQYYDLYGRQYQRIADDGDTIERLSDRFSNVAVSIDELNIFNDYNEKREMFPMYVDINFSTDKTTTFAQILDDTDFSDMFLTKIINKTIKSEWSDVEVNTSQENLIQRGGPEDNVEKTNTFSSNTRRSWDLPALIQEMRDSEEELNKENAIYLGDYENEAELRRREEFKFFNSLMYTIFSSKVQTLVKQKMRTYKQMVNGERAYSETVLYRIAKFDGNPEGREPIQSFWFSNSNKVDVLRFIDTQVKYDKEYTYVVYAYQLVIGNKYWYSDLDVDSFENHAAFKVYQEPSLRLVEIPYFSVTGRVMDSPPVVPDLEFFPYKGVDNKIGVNFRGNVGDYRTESIIISQEDAKQIRKLREVQKLKEGELLRYKSDDHPKIFEVYRMDTKPKSYLDFSGKLIASIDADVSLKTLQSATSATFIDNIEPNKKYYYTFRSIDNHGHFSNPTALYEVEIINENGTIFPIIRCVDFDKQSRMYLKPARRYIQLVPNVLQSLINEEKSGYETARTADDVKKNVHLGVLKDGLWKKNFKIRLTSKATGKKIDFNVKFDYKPEEKV